MKLEIELPETHFPVDALKYTAAGVRVAYAKGFINIREFAEPIADALEREARRLEDAGQKGGAL